MKKVLIFILALALCFAFVACGDDTTCTEHVDADANGKCDNCDAAVEPDEGGNGTASSIELVKNGAATFTIVSTEDTSIDIGKPFSNFIKTLNDCISESNVTSVFEHIEAKGTEIIIGNVATRGDKFKEDNASPYEYGYEGWSIKIVDNNIHVLAGSSGAYKDALKYLEETVFGINDATDSIDNITMTAEQQKTEQQTEFDVNVKIGDTPLSEYVFAINSGDSTAIKAINAVRSQLFKRTGAYLKTVVSSKLAEGQKAIWVETLTLNGDRSTPEGARIYVENGNLHIESEFKNKLEELVYDYLIGTVAESKKSNVTVSSSLNEPKDVRNVYYADFGAVGDGETDDFFAIKACHDYANEWGHTANADGPSKTYYIGEYLKDGDPATSIIVQTDTNWHGCTFIFDDSIIRPKTPCYNSHIFHIKPSKDSYAYSGSTVPVKSLFKGAADLAGWEPGIECLILIENSDERHYIRYGNNNNNGSSQHEIIYVHADGTIDSSTPLQWDYERITRLEVFPCDTNLITVTGGDGDERATIKTIFNGAPSLYTYYKRNIHIDRSNVILQNINHIVEGEEETGAPYSGFTNVQYANNVTIQNMLIHRLKSYYLETDTSNNMGSYELGAGYSNNVLWKNIKQDVFFDEDGGVSYKGVMGTNYCKNLTFDDNFLCSFDAHCGVYNGTIKNTTIEHINFIGDGLITIENCTVYVDGSGCGINLRSDYGSWWKGDAIFKDVDFKYEIDKTSGTDVRKTVSLFSSAWVNHTFGYTCYLPENITLDNVRMLGFTVTVDEITKERDEKIVKTNEKELYLFSSSIYSHKNIDISNPNADMSNTPNDWVACTCATRPLEDFYNYDPDNHDESIKKIKQYFNDTDGDGRCNNSIYSQNGGSVWCWGYAKCECDSFNDTDGDYFCDNVKADGKECKGFDERVPTHVNANPYIGTKTVTITNKETDNPLKVVYPFTPQFDDLDVTVDGVLIIENGDEKD